MGILSLSVTIFLMHLECYILLFCKREYEHVFYGVRLIRTTKKT